MQITRLLRIDAGHRLMRHEGKCRSYHGHSYTFEVTVEAPTLDDCGRVVDFSVVKERVGGWLDARWDHGMILQMGDPLVEVLEAVDPPTKMFVIGVPPTAENLATYLLAEAATLLPPPLRVVRVRCWETPNCYADAEGNPNG